MKSTEVSVETEIKLVEHIVDIDCRDRERERERGAEASHRVASLSCHGEIVRSDNTVLGPHLTNALRPLTDMSSMLRRSRPRLISPHDARVHVCTATLRSAAGLINRTTWSKYVHRLLHGNSLDSENRFHPPPPPPRAGGLIIEAFVSILVQSQSQRSLPGGGGV